MAIRISPRRTRAVAVLAALTLTMIQFQLVTASQASASSACNGAFSGSPQGTLAISSSVPTNQDIQAGQTITITATWNTGDWSGLDAFYNCWGLNGGELASLELEEKPPANDGTIVQTITVPNSMSDGDELCVRSRLSGQPRGGNTTTQKSNELCWTVGAAPQNPNLKITKTANHDGVAAGSSFTYSLKVENISTVAANNVVVTDTIPTSLTIGNITGANCNTNGQSVTCNLGTLAAGASQTIAINVTASNGSCPSVDNTGTVTATNDSNPNDDSDSESVDVTCSTPTPEPNVTVRIIKTNDANGDGTYTNNEEAKRAGLDVSFRLVITNTSDEPIAINEMTDSFPGDVIDLLADACSNLDGTELDPGESAECEFIVQNYSPDEHAAAKINTAQVCVELIADPSNTDCDDDDSGVSSAEVLGRTVTPPPTRTPPSGTAFTGSEGTLGFGLLAMALLLFGTGVMYAGYRTRQRFDR